ncbi:MAG: hypothetical protein E7271_08025 [Lachnospiraceae bacterium]|jgi:hypothetical protein|nr:hypothetical protein [Lachnospiraceae bacterium]
MGFIKRKLANIILLCFIVVTLLLGCSGGASRRSVVGLSDPIQQETTGSTSLFVDNYNVTVDYKYSYDISALVVSTKDYSSLDFSGKLAPKDVALAWGAVAEYNDRINFNWSQSGRWYRWRTSSYDDIEPVGGVDGVTAHSSNNHLIPADDNVKKLVKNIKAGDCVRIKGYLVNVAANDGKGANFWWNSSTTRNDSGDGSCEVIYVTDIEWLDK